jgi:hypothetical protein
MLSSLFNLCNEAAQTLAVEGDCSLFSNRVMNNWFLQSVNDGKVDLHLTFSDAAWFCLHRRDSFQNDW